MFYQILNILFNMYEFQFDTHFFKDKGIQNQRPLSANWLKKICIEEGREKGSLTNNGFYPLLLIEKNRLLGFNRFESGVEDSITYYQFLVHC